VVRRGDDVKPWLWLSPSLAHKLSPIAVNGLSMMTFGRKPEWDSFTWRNLKFPNRLGLAGGVDKDARNVEAWWNMGAGFLEIGTVTPKPQAGNPGLVVDRDEKHEAIWNKLGFPSQGVERVKNRLKALPRPFTAPVFANIGKNRDTSLEDAHRDYSFLLLELDGLVDGFVINVSSPNTQGLRELLKPERLREFLKPILASRPSKAPILLKLSPDLEDDDLKNALDTSHELGIDGWVLTNTSQGLREGLNFPSEGGVSGRPLTRKSEELLKRAVAVLGPKREGRLIVSVGGVMTADDVASRLRLGADLVQVYSALIFSGPYFFRKVAKWRQANRVP
jgi:dihydroorotate dehydrogenase